MNILFFIASITLNFFFCSLLPQALQKPLGEHHQLQLEELNRQREQYQMRAEEVTQRFLEFKDISQSHYECFKKEFMFCQTKCTNQANDIKKLKERIDQLETKQPKENNDNRSFEVDKLSGKNRSCKEDLPLLCRQLEDSTPEVRKNLETLTIALQATKAGKEALRVENKKLNKVISNNYKIIASQQFKIELLEKINTMREAYGQAQENELHTTQQALTNAQDRLAHTTSIKKFLTSPLNKRNLKGDY